mmetsp:Transcript_57765/g.159739  ORF Transcript_57765/g.159739 Transcript_57765/m.159739 type:complete len:366 (+) Transcript_57765:204-1301(+)
MLDLQRANRLGPGLRSLRLRLLQLGLHLSQLRLGLRGLSARCLLPLLGRRLAILGGLLGRGRLPHERFGLLHDRLGLLGLRLQGLRGLLGLQLHGRVRGSGGLGRGRIALGGLQCRRRLHQPGLQLLLHLCSLLEPLCGLAQLPLQLVLLVGGAALHELQPLQRRERLRLLLGEAGLPGLLRQLLRQLPQLRRSRQVRRARGAERGRDLPPGDPGSRAQSGCFRGKLHEGLPPERHCGRARRRSPERQLPRERGRRADRRRQVALRPALLPRERCSTGEHTLREGLLHDPLHHDGSLQHPVLHQGGSLGTASLHPGCNHEGHQCGRAASTHLSGNAGAVLGARCPQHTAPSTLSEREMTRHGAES